MNLSGRRYVLWGPQFDFYHNFIVILLRLVETKLVAPKAFYFTEEPYLEVCMDTRTPTYNESVIFANRKLRLIAKHSFVCKL